MGDMTDEDTYEFGPDPGETRPELTELVPASVKELDIRPSELRIFLDRLADGWGEFEAGLAAPLGWSPARIRRVMNHQDLHDLVWAIHERDNESVERAILLTARAGNPAAQKLWAYSKMQHRGWADKKQVTVDGEINLDVVHSVRQALEEQTRELTADGTPEGVAALQAAIGLDDSEIHDA